MKNIAYIEAVGATDAFTNGALMRAAGWNGSTPETPKAWMAVIPTASTTSFTLTFDQRGANDNMPNDFLLQYSTDGINWSDIQQYKVRSEGQEATVFTKFEDIQFSTGGGHETLYIRWLCNSNTNYLGGVLQKAGTNFLRNVVVSGLK